MLILVLKVRRHWRRTLSYWRVNIPKIYLRAGYPDTQDKGILFAKTWMETSTEVMQLHFRRIPLYSVFYTFISYFSGYRWFNLACNIYRNAKWILFCHSKEENNRHIQRSRCFGRRAKFTRDDNLINYPSDWNKKHQLLILFIQTSLPSNPF